MAHRLIVRNKIKVHVKGELKDEDGSPVEFDFHLHCKRKTQEEINKVVGGKDGKTIKDFLKENTDGWDDMQDVSGAPLPFTPENFDSMLNQDAGMGMVCFQSYLRDSGAVVKN
ncbi:hypothetical protein [Massilia yuzhufengensis]|uniref:Uncharacterized protein n=1 Tax=Massilia yuzhufengensis TaxID=1164594 RepID=A0A1I1VKL8_9BURK|nr:hypothetical protein [Massilia yuzhufengensis]SFD83315.1 hypothetical protein SAMN05216204_14014 [Massilia yuzhufengensis]